MWNFGFDSLASMSVSEIGAYHLKLWHFECAPHGDDPIGVGRLLSQTRNSDSQGLLGWAGLLYLDGRLAQLIT